MAAELITREEWNREVQRGRSHRLQDGGRAVLRWDPQRGTVLQRIELI